MVNRRAACNGQDPLRSGRNVICQLREISVEVSWRGNGCPEAR